MSGDSQKKIWNTMNSSEVLTEVRALLDHDKLKQLIDEPICECMNKFSWDDVPVNTPQFNRLVINFVTFVYDQLKMDISDHDAFSLVVEALNQDNGYHGALLDAISGDKHSVEQVVGILAEYLKDHTRERYFKWVFNTKIEPVYWKIKCEMVNILVSEHPANFGDSKLFANHLDILIRSQMGIKEHLNEIFSDFSCT